MALRCPELEKYPWKHYSGFTCSQTLVTLPEISNVSCAFRVQTVKAWEVTSATLVVNSHLCFYWNERFISKRKVTLLLHSCCIFSNLGWILMTLRDICSLKIMMHFFIVIKFVFTVVQWKNKWSWRNKIRWRISRDGKGKESNIRFSTLSYCKIKSLSHFRC